MLKIDQKVEAHWVEKSNDEWIKKSKKGKIYKDFLFAYCNKDMSLQNLYGILFEDGERGNFWANQMEVIEDE